MQGTEASNGGTDFVMYDGAVHLNFNPKSPRYRYTVSDDATNVRDQSVRGVTTVLRDIINKPDLLQWPMNMSHQKIFGAAWDDNLKEYFYKEEVALLKCGKEYTPEELQEIMKAGARAHVVRSDRGKDIGTMVHKAVEVYVRSQDASEALQAALGVAEGEVAKEDRKAIEKAFNTFKDFWDSLHATVIDVERPVYSRGLNYAGTCDLIAEINGRRYLIDLKTTNSSKKAPLGVYSEYFMQLGAYSYAYKEETGTLMDDLAVIRVSKEGVLSVVTATDMKIEVGACERMFAYAVRVHDWLEEAAAFLQDPHFKSHLNRLADDGRMSGSN